MNKSYLFIAILAVTSAVMFFAPHALQEASHWFHWAAVLTSFHHVTEEIGHLIQHREKQVKA